MRKLRMFGSLALALAGFMATADVAANAAGAIAIGRCDRYGYSYGYQSTGGARRRALNECEKDGSSCQVVVTLHGACGAFAVSGSGGCGARGWSYAPSRARAERLAIEGCEDHGGRGCWIRAWVCDGGP
jgi:Domain of unknown function (DUF4189)